MDLTNLPKRDWKQTEASEELGMAETGIFPAQQQESKLPNLGNFDSKLPNLGSLEHPADSSIPQQALIIAKELGYNEIVSIGALEDGIRLYQNRTAEMIIELGKRLIILQEAVGRGDFLKRIEMLGFSKSTAYRFMSATKKALKLPNLGSLIQKTGSQQKLLELLVLDDEDVSRIADGADGAIVTLDEVDLMSATELRKIVREHKNKPALINDEQVEKELAEKTKPLVERIKQLEFQRDNVDKQYNALASKNEVLEGKLKQLTQKDLPGKTLISPETAAIREDAFAMEYGIRTYADSLTALLDKTSKQFYEDGLALGAIGNAIAASYLTIQKLVNYAEAVLGEAYPPELDSRHVLTAHELDRLESCKTMIEHKAVNDQQLREARRMDEAKRPVGRPSKAKE